MTALFGLPPKPPPGLLPGVRPYIPPGPQAADAETGAKAVVATAASAVKAKREVRVLMVI
jgi:hypothetical protein